LSATIAQRLDLAFQASDLQFQLMDLVPEVIALTRLQPQRFAERPTSEVSKCAGSEPEASSRNTWRADPDATTAAAPAPACSNTGSVTNEPPISYHAISSG
jgi:hypothetical protein